MAGRSLEEAQAAQRIALGRPPCKPLEAAHVAIPTSAPTIPMSQAHTIAPLLHTPVLIGGVPYYPVPIPPPTVATAHFASPHPTPIAIPISNTPQSLGVNPQAVELAPGDLYEYHAFLAEDHAFFVTGIQGRKPRLSGLATDWSKFREPAH